MDNVPISQGGHVSPSGPPRLDRATLALQQSCMIEVTDIEQRLRTITHQLHETEKEFHQIAEVVLLNTGSAYRQIRNEIRMESLCDPPMYVYARECNIEQLELISELLNSLIPRYLASKELPPNQLPNIQRRLNNIKTRARELVLTFANVLARLEILLEKVRAAPPNGVLTSLQRVLTTQNYFAWALPKQTFAGMLENTINVASDAFANRA